MAYCLYPQPQKSAETKKKERERESLPPKHEQTDRQIEKKALQIAGRHIEKDRRFHETGPKMLSVNGNALEVEVVGEKILRKTSLFGNSRKLSARMDTEVQEAFKLFDKDKVKFN